MGPLENPNPARDPTPEALTSSRQPDIRICVHKEAQVEHVPDLLSVEYQDALEQNHVSRVDHSGLWQPAREKPGLMVPISNQGPDWRTVHRNRLGWDPPRGWV